MSLLSRWWRGDLDERTAEAQSRVDESPDVAFIAVDGDLPHRIGLQKIELHEFQTITRDTDIKAISKAIVFGEADLRSGRRHMVGNGVRCERCGQEGQLYHHRDSMQMLACEHVHGGIRELYDQIEREHWQRMWDRGYYATIQPISGKVIVKGYTVNSVPCDVNIVLHLRMRHCWFN